MSDAGSLELVAVVGSVTRPGTQRLRPLVSRRPPRP
jgi:hypothetical protein